MQVRMLIATHKQYRMPDDRIYLPVFVGDVLKKNRPLGFQSDATGINISKENSHFNELTATYWAWKNLNADIIGLNHYRRYFVSKRSLKKSFKYILNERQINELLLNADIVLPVKRNYYIETIESHYSHSHDPKELDAVKTVFAGLSRNYQRALESVLISRSAHMFNMFIMKKADFDQYCTWLFGTLRAIEKELDFDELTGNEQRALGFIAEILMDVWVLANKKTVVECPVQFMESNHWPKKIAVFLVNKFTGSQRRVNTHIN